MTTDTRLLTLEECEDILADEPKTKGDKLRLLAVTMQQLLPAMGKPANTPSDVVADLMNWADDADFADHATNCFDCASSLIEKGLDYAENRFK